MNKGTRFINGKEYLLYAGSLYSKEEAIEYKALALKDYDRAAIRKTNMYSYSVYVHGRLSDEETRKRNH